MSQRNEAQPVLEVDRRKQIKIKIVFPKDEEMARHQKKSERAPITLFGAVSYSFRKAETFQRQTDTDTDTDGQTRHTSKEKRAVG